ncbi:MAG: hypothetical protein LBT47_11970 [Deltaproteobacteria bacterium]|jgi:malate dehydrogenase (oxaloacetate-decarboxylating)|nr:hypothetical protein [Deltaproteobacteria bacterium]
MPKVNDKDLKDNQIDNYDYLGQALPACRTAAAAPSVLLDPSDRFQTVAVITDGSRIPVLGDVGPWAALPLAEAKCRLLSQMTGLTAIPLTFSSSSIEDTVRLIEAITPSFGALNLEAIDETAAFYVKRRISETKELPVYIDSLDGLPVICLAALNNALKVVEKKMSEVRLVIAGGETAGLAMVDFLRLAGAADIVVCDRLGAIHRGRSGPTNWVKEELASKTNPRQLKGNLPKVTAGSDVLILLSAAQPPPKDLVATMAPGAVVFNLTDTTTDNLGLPKVYASLADDNPNRLIPALLFPGLIKGIMEAKARLLNPSMKMAAAMALANLVPENSLGPLSVVPPVTKPNLVSALTEAVSAAAAASGASRLI